MTDDGRYHGLVPDFTPRETPVSPEEIEGARTELNKGGFPVRNAGYWRREAAKERRSATHWYEKTVKLREVIIDCDACLTDILFPSTEPQGKIQAGKILAKIANQRLKGGMTMKYKDMKFPTRQDMREEISRLTAEVAHLNTDLDIEKKLHAKASETIGLLSADADKAAHWYEKTVQLSDALRDAEREVERLMKHSIEMGQVTNVAKIALEQVEAENARLREDNNTLKEVK